MKEFLLFFCAIIVNVNSQRSCGCSPPPCCAPPIARPLPPCPRPLPPCPPPPVCRPPPPCPAPIPVCPRPLPSCSCSAPVIEFLDYPVTYEVVTPCTTALPTCNCPSLPSLPVSPQIIPSIGSPVIPGLSIGLSPCLGGVDFAPVAPVGLINPFLPAASPISALAPTVSSLYPPIDPCNCGCKHLRKIPMPPPCI